MEAVKHLWRVDVSHGMEEPPKNRTCSLIQGEGWAQQPHSGVWVTNKMKAQSFRLSRGSSTTHSRSWWASGCFLMPGVLKRVLRKVEGARCWAWEDTLWLHAPIIFSQPHQQVCTPLPELLWVYLEGNWEQNLAQALCSLASHQMCGSRATVQPSLPPQMLLWVCWSNSQLCPMHGTGNWSTGWGVCVCINSFYSLSVNRQHNPLVTTGWQHLQHLGSFPDFSYDLGQIAWPYIFLLLCSNESNETICRKKLRDL